VPDPTCKPPRYSEVPCPPGDLVAQPEEVGCNAADCVLARAGHRGAFNRPQRFIDEQVRGPFHRFHHEHLFESVDGGSRMIDIVEFEAPAGWLGRLAERLVLASYVRSLIDERNRYLTAQSAR
jgi:ligand-binding SRPBCC domain-containing protein